MMLTLAGAAAAASIVPTAGPVASFTTPTPGTITIAPATAALPAESSRVFDEAVQRATLRAGFTLLPGQDHSRYTAQVTVTQTARGVVASGRSAAPPPLASMSGSVSLSLPSGGARFRALAVTELKVVISRRSDGQAIWSGSAVTARASDSPSGSVDVVAQALAAAVLSQFPNQAKEPVSVP